MPSVPPALQAFWLGPIASSPAFGVLTAWSEIIQAPMPEAIEPPKPASHISSALRRLVDKPPTWRGPDAVTQTLEVIHDRREYAGGLLRLSLERLLKSLETPEESSVLLEPVAEWMAETGAALVSMEAETARLRERLSEAEAGGRIPPAATEWMADVASCLRTRLKRVEHQLEVCLDHMAGRISDHSFQDIRRRLSWVLSLREFERPFDWNAVPDAALNRIPVTLRSEVGMILLLRFRPEASEREIALYERAAGAKLDRFHIAFGLEGVIAETAAGEFRRYDSAAEDAVHQHGRILLPYRNMQAVLLGLWAAGARLRLFSNSESSPEAFFNDFPLLKVAFGFLSPEEAARFLKAGDLRRYRGFRDARQREEAWRRYFKSPEGRQFLENLASRSGSGDLTFLKSAAIPYPDFKFDALVDFPTVATERAEALGFGRRRLDPEEDGEALLESLERFLSRPAAGVSENVLNWLDTWDSD